MMHGADPAMEQRVPLFSIVDEQQSSLVSPEMLPQPTPPHCPHNELQQAPLNGSSSSIPEKPLLQVLLESVRSVFRPRKQGLKSTRE